MEQQEPGYFEQTEAMLRQYVNDRILLLKLKASQQSAKLAAQVFVLMIMVLLGLLVLLFLSLTAAYYFADLTGSLLYGFGIVAGFYLLLLIIVLLVRKKYLSPYLTNMVIRIILDKTHDDESVDTNQPN
ncbi:phage holin family protein [Flavihumibacter profundi]|jgi:hypothetical protein|uniref:phage holin family protein n=1 Tax=Flavihumibacter profundi TaxID=2716883 RepID=UPI001CC7719C|nr:phage holin family protein [Flavihumibacter profundi]MBZ5858216.1 hypothetical protein [Flavihumibacter profundi]